MNEAMAAVDVSTTFDYYPQQPQHQHGLEQDDDSDDEPFYELVKQPVHMVVIYTLAYATVFLLAVTGNTLVICVVCRNTAMHSVINYFIVNLAVADLLVGLLCLPITLVANLVSGQTNVTVLSRFTPKFHYADFSETSHETKLDDLSRPVASLLITGGGRFPQILTLFRVRKLEFPVAV